MSVTKADSIKIIFRVLLGYGLLFTLLFLPAGHWGFWQGWLLFANYIILGIVGFALFKDKQELLKERIKPGKGVKWWDRIFYGCFLILSFTMMFIASVDAGNLGWTKDFSLWFILLGFVVFNLSNVVLVWAMYCNPFFSTMVRIQDDRGQTVIKNGPYRFVRHPGYTGAVFGVLALPLCLGSIYALIPAILIVLAFIIRTYLEDSTLQNELDGYSDYIKEVQYRLIYKIW